MRFAMGFISAFVLLIVVIAAAIWTGAYNFAASEAHNVSLRSVIEIALRRSVSRRADALTPPAAFGREDLRNGAREFMEYCVHCHGAPGVEPDEWATGMRPDPPDLGLAAAEWTTEEIFWIVKHGINMTGMPAFGDTESDPTIWRITAFVKQLPRITPDEYARIEVQLGGRHAR